MVGRIDARGGRRPFPGRPRQAFRKLHAIAAHVFVPGFAPISGARRDRAPGAVSGLVRADAARARGARRGA
ncbi:hypothetical protein, partial [Burkholderia sp. Tr-860]